MAAKYHIGKNGPSRCPAQKRCRLNGGNAEHYPSMEEAREAYVKMLEKEHSLTGTISKRAPYSIDDVNDSIPDLSSKSKRGINSMLGKGLRVRASTDVDTLHYSNSTESNVDVVGDAQDIRSIDELIGAHGRPF